MQKSRFFSFVVLLFLISSSSSKNFLSKEFFTKTTNSYMKINSSILKKVINNKDFYLVDARPMTTIALGYISNSIIVPYTMFTWLSSVVPELSNIIIISDKANYQETFKKLETIKNYKIYGYCLYEEVSKFSYFNIQKIVYDENTKESLETIVKNKQNIIDIRETKEYKETGVIKEAKLIPLSTFLKNYGNIPKKGDVYVFCKSGMRAVVGMSFAKRAGYSNNFIIMRGGMDQAIKNKYSVVPYPG